MLGTSKPAASIASSRACSASFSRSTSVAYSICTAGSSASSTRSKKRWVVRTAAAYASAASRIAMIVLSAMPTVISPRHPPGSAEEPARRAVRFDLGHPHDDLGALGHGLRAAEAVQIGGGVTGVDAVDPHGRECLRVLHGDHVDRGLGGAVAERRERVLHGLGVGGAPDRAQPAAHVDDH